MTVVQIAAIVSTGLMAGVYFIYAVAIMPGLRRLDDTSFVRAFQAIDTAIINPVFLIAFFAPAVLCAALAVGSWGQPDSGWTAAALGLNVVIVVITVAVNVPLNDAIKAAGPVADGEASTVRAAFAEGRWTTANWVRVLANLVALACLVLAR